MHSHHLFYRTVRAEKLSLLLKLTPISHPLTPCHVLKEHLARIRFPISGFPSYLQPQGPRSVQSLSTLVYPEL